MRRRFGWFAVGGVAVVALATTGADLQAGTPLATLRQAVMPAREPLPATLPIVTTAPTEISPVDVSPTEVPLTKLPAPPAPPVLHLPPALLPAQDVAPPTPAADLRVPADLGVEVQQAGPVLVRQAMSEPFLPEPIGPQQVVVVEATEPVVVAADPVKPTVVPVPVSATEPAKIERLPANVAGEGAAFGDDPTFRKPLGAIRVDVAPSAGALPPNEAAAYYGAAEGVVPRAEHDTLFFWQATNLCHRPLYFEQDYLERDGRSFGAVQPLVSGAQFFGSVPLLPYRMVRQPPCRCIYTLGESRPDGYGRRWGR